MAVSLSLATVEGSVPLDYRLYLPREWAEDKERRSSAGVPEQIAFATKGEIAWAQIEAALDAGIARGTVLMRYARSVDAAYGDEAAMRDRLTAHGLPYAVAVRLQTAVWCDQAKPEQPLSVLELARTLPPARYRTINWREGTKQRLRSRFARVRVRAAHGKRTREEEWLLIECGTHVPWPKGQAEPTRYFLSTLPADISFKQLVAVAKMRWRIERDYLELKQEVGLGHYEGRNWRGFQPSREAGASPPMGS